MPSSPAHTDTAPLGYAASAVPPVQQHSQEQHDPHAGQAPHQRPAARAVQGHRVIIIADDLTGANVNASMLAAQGFSAATCTSSLHWNPHSFQNFDVVSVNTGSRQLPPEEARRLTADAMRVAVTLHPVVIAKRIDSTLRGNLGSEIEGALEALPANTLVLLCPAFPASGRMAAGGHLIVDGLPLERTSAAKDPVNPIYTSHILQLFTSQSTLPAAALPLDVVLRGAQAIGTHLRALHATGCRVVVCDALTDEDIAALATAAAALDVPVLAADPGPLTTALALAQLGHAPQSLENRVLLVVGSVMDIVRHQLDMLCVKRDCHLLCARCHLLAEPEGSPAREEELTRLVSGLAAAPDTAEVLGLCTARLPEDVLDLEELARTMGVSVAEVSQRINSGLAEAAARLLPATHLRLGGLFTSGGEVTLAVTQRLHALGFSVRDEVLSRAMYGRFIGGLYPGLSMVTKGGFVGGPEAIDLCIDYLLTKISTRTRAD